MTIHMLATIAFFSISTMAQAQSTKGDRMFAWQIDMTENNNYDSAFAYGFDACMESVHVFSVWTSIEPDTGNFDAAFIANFLDIINIYYPAQGVEIELQIAPTNTGVKEVPSELMGLSFDHPDMINRFKVLLDTIFAHIPDVTLSALNIGNESDINFGTDAAQYNAFKVFINAAALHAKELYFNIHGNELKVGTTFTHHGLVNAQTSGLCQSVNDGLDIVATTYYPLDVDFTMKPPSAVGPDFSALVALYPDTAQPIYFVECGYASSLICNSSVGAQAQFWKNVFSAWDTYQQNIKYISVFKSTDWSTAAVNELATYYGIQDTIFKEYLRTLGTRTWPGNGENKQAYEEIKCELQARDWCATNCNVHAIESVDSRYNYRIYPNPTNDLIHIELHPSGIDDLTLQLFNAQGEVVQHFHPVHPTIQLDRMGLPSGLYFYQLTEKEITRGTGKLILH